MVCDHLLQLLGTDWRRNTNHSSCIAAHIRSCSHCRNGQIQCSEALIASDQLNCEQCRGRFPVYYEATRPECPLVEMTDIELIETALHLSHCTNCHEEYATLVLLSELEERNEMLEE